MTDARKKILSLSLPDLELTLTKEEWAELTAIIASLEKQTVEEFKIRFAEIKSETLINPKNIPKSIEFITIWLDLTESIATWTLHLNQVWGNVTQSNLTSDCLVPLIIELLPDNAAQLQQLQKKLDLASHIDDISERGCYLSNFCVATSAKIIELTEKIPPQNSTMERNILIVATEVNNLERIEQLIPVCMNYKDYLRNTFVLLFQAADKETYQQYLELCNETPDGVPDKNHLMDIVMDNLSTNKLIMKNPDLIPLLHKYFVLYEMHTTLLRPYTSATDKLLEFSAKFQQLDDMLMKNLDSNARTFLKMASANLGMNRVYEYIGWEDAETQFLKLAGFFSKKTQDEVEIKDNISSMNVKPI